MPGLNPDSLTHRFTSQAYNWIVSFGPRLLIAIVVFFIGQWIIKMINKGLSKILSSRRISVTLRPFIENFLKVVLQILLVLLIMGVLGIRLTLFAALVGAFGVAVGLTLSGTMQNFAGGILIILLKPFIAGDNIITQGQEGTVTSIRLFYTVIRTFNNTTLIVPNSKLSNEVIFNLTREKNRRLDVSIKFNNSVDFEAVKKIVLNTIENFDDSLKDPPHRVGIEKVEADGFTVSINLWLSSHGFQDTKLLFNERLLENLKSLTFKE
jgi:small conductance mechanosensitive channel